MEKQSAKLRTYMASKYVEARGNGYNIYKYPSTIEDAKKHKVSLLASYPNRTGTNAFY